MAEPCPKNWVQLILSDDEEAIAELWIKLMQWGETAAGYKGQDEDVGRDAAIAAFHRIQRMKVKFEEQDAGEDSSFCRMCRFVLAHEIIRIINRNRKFVMAPLSEGDHPIEPDLDPKLSPADILKRLDPCLDELTGLRRSVIELRYLRHLSPAEIATQLGATPGAIYVALHRALAQLQKCLRNQGYESVDGLLSL